jgi:subtilisin family serine protease
MQPALVTKAVVLLALAVSVHARAASPEDSLARELARAPHVPRELLVQWAPDTTPAERAAARNRIGGVRAEAIVRANWRASHDGGGEMELLHLPPGLVVAAAVREIERDAAVDFAEPNWIYNHQAVSNDPYYTNGSLWGMYGDATTPVNARGSQAGEAWAAGKTDCSTVWVGIIDEGYMYTHEDLLGNAGVNPGEVADNGVDDDGNGFVDDVYGWDFAGGNNTVYDGLPDDHGSHVAGTIGATGGNGKGVAGVCWKVNLMNAKFLGNAGGTTANAIRAVDYFTDMKTRHGLNFVATSNSWGGGGFSQGLKDAIERANAANILFVAAAGNSTYNCEVSSCYPAEYSNANVISVASIDSNGAISSFSNYGATTIDIGAPGRGIYSTVPKRVSGKIASRYASYSGTSMATPHVSGAVALYAAHHPGSGAAAIKAAILGAAVSTPALAGKTVTGGRLDVSGF